MVAQACPEHVFAMCFQPVAIQCEAGNPSPDGFFLASAGQFSALKAIKLCGNDLFDGLPVGFFEPPPCQGLGSPLEIPADQAQTLLLAFLQRLIDLCLP